MPAKTGIGFGARIIYNNEHNVLNYILSFSAGGCTCSVRSTLPECIARADARMYEVKHNKKKHIFFNLPVNNLND